jgi:flagellar FliL protein
MATTATKQPKAAPKTSAKPEAETDEDAAPAKKPRSLLKILLLLTPLVLAGAGGGVWFFMQGQEPAAPAKPGPAKPVAKVKHDPSKPPVFVTLDPFVVNLQQSDVPSQYLQVGLVLKLKDEELVEPIKLHMPEIRNRVLLLLSGKSASELATPEGKKTLATELAHEVMQPLAGSVPAKAIDSVLFTSFVIQ